MKTIKIPEVGDIITLKSFAFTGKEGGTGMSNWSHDEQWTNKLSKFAIVKEWEDSECGQRGWAIPDQTDKALMDYIQRNVKKNKNGEYIVYWSEFDILTIK
jgi:hypothetical protein